MAQEKGENKLQCLRATGRTEEGRNRFINYILALERPYSSVPAVPIFFSIGSK